LRRRRKVIRDIRTKDFNAKGLVELSSSAQVNPRGCINFIELEIINKELTCIIDVSSNEGIYID